MEEKGNPNMDLLGYNQNAGEMIVLKLRTDNTKGFRPYHDLINTLIHEMTHNVWGPHDNNFWKLFGEMKAQYMKFHRFWSHGGQAADSNATGQFQGFAGADDGETDADFGRTLGTASGEAEQPLTDVQRKERALLAAEARKVTGGIDFVNSGGKVMMVCACGQLHDAGDCPFILQPSDAGANNDPADMEIEPAAEGPNPTTFSGAATAVVSDPAHSSSALAPNAAVAALVSEDVEMADPEPDSSLETGGAGEPSSSTAATQPDHEFENSRGTLLPDEGPLAGLCQEDLEALGLGGAAAWLQSFSEKLKALTAHIEHSTARQALGLLLLLVKNIVNSPDNAKYRRIKVDNPKIRMGLLAAGPEVEKLITLLGFEAATENGGPVFLLRDSTFDPARLQMGQDLLQRQLSSLPVSAH